MIWVIGMSEIFGRVAEHPAVALVRILVLEEAVQERSVHRVDADLERLQPVAIDHALEGEGVGCGRDEAVEIRKRRRLARAEIGPQDAALLDHRIGFLFDVGAEVAVVGLGRRLQACAVDVEQPAVERAAQSAVFQPPVGQVGAAMRAMAADQAVAAPVVLEGDEVFAKQPHRLDRPVAGQLIDQRRRLPVAPHQRAGRGAGRGAGDEIVLFGAEHGRTFADPQVQVYDIAGRSAARSEGAGEVVRSQTRDRRKFTAHAPSLQRSRISGAPFHAAPHPGNPAYLINVPAAPAPSGLAAAWSATPRPRGFGPLDRPLLPRAVEKAAQRVRVEKVHRNDQRRLERGEHLHHAVEVERETAVDRRHHHVEPADVVKLLLREGVMQMAEMGDAQVGDLENEDRIAIALGAAAPVADVGRHVAHPHVAVFHIADRRLSGLVPQPRSTYLIAGSGWSV